VTRKKLGEVLLNPKCIKEVSSVEGEQGRPSSGLHEERLNGERHFSDSRERVVASVTCEGKKLRKERMYLCEGCSRKVFTHADKWSDMSYFSKSYIHTYLHD
jgi:hypothetical protein